jgi:hypothetical protein
MGEDDGLASRPAAAVDRGAPLVATGARWAASAAALALAFVAALQCSLWFLHSDRTLAHFQGALVVAIGVEALLVFFLLRAEESRLARELRTARTGTSTLRAMVARRRQEVPFLARLFSTKLGTAAVLLADGDRSSALDLLGQRPLLMQGGRLEALRRVVEADAVRAAGGDDSRERCAERLRARSRIGNREADLYATHVLVKAILERGDPETALELAETLARSSDEEERLYLVWLCAWFDLDVPDGPPAIRPLEGEVRLAALLARAHGAEKLVEKLEKRVAAIAHPQPGE